MAWRTLSVLGKQRICFQSSTLLLLGATAMFLSLSSYAQEQAGKTIMAKGQVVAKDQQQQRDLSRRSPVYAQDLVATGQLSATQLRMSDGALLSMQASSELAIYEYEFNPQDRQGTVNMSLLKGGLRTVTGALLQSNDSYKLTTPVASIGVRGTHYEAELIDNDLYLAAWKGIIDIEVTAGVQGQRFSLGPSLAYSFAVVRADGTVEYLLKTPSVFSVGHSSELNLEKLIETDDPDSVPLLVKISPLGAQNIDIDGFEDTVFQAQTNSQIYIDNDRLFGDWLPQSPSIITRTGTVVFDRVEQQSIVSSLGDVNDFSMSMSVDFDSSKIPTGNLSFSDSAGEWFAAFDGLIADTGLTLSVNFASHGNNLASGEIEALLIDGAQGVLGTLSLAEINAPTVTSSGSFVLRQTNP